MSLPAIKARLTETPDVDLAWCVAEIERLTGENGRLRVIAEREVADAIVRHGERARRVFWTDYTTGEPMETGGNWPASEISIANEVCGFFRMLRVWTLAEEVERLRVLSETRAPMCQCSDDEACRFVRERDAARALLPSPAVLEVLGLAHERLVYAILDGDVVVAYDMAIDEAGEWLERMVERG